MGGALVGSQSSRGQTPPQGSGEDNSTRGASWLTSPHHDYVGPSLPGVLWDSESGGSGHPPQLPKGPWLLHP